MKSKRLITEISGERLIYLFWGIYILSLILKNTSFFMLNEIYNIVLKIVRYICYVIFATRIFVDWKNGEKITIPIILLFTLALIISIATKNKNLVFLITILFSLRKLNFNKLVNIAFKIIFFVFFIVICLALLKIVPDWTFSRGTGTIRHSLGFQYATDTIGTYLSIICMYVYIRKSKATIYELVILETINIFLYLYTNGRTSFVLISSILFIQLLTKFSIIKKVLYTRVIQVSIKILCYSLPIILFILFHCITYMYANNNNFAIEVDEILSGRIKYTYQAYKNYQIKWFGQSIKWKRMGWTWVY